MIKWLPAAGYIATSRPRSGGALTGPPGPVQAYFESQQPHGSLSVLPKWDPNWPWRQVGAGPAASPQCLPMARSGPCTSLGVRVGLVDFARPRVSRCRGCASLPEFYFPPRSPRIRIMRRQTSYETAIWLLIKLGLCAHAGRSKS